MKTMKIICQITMGLLLAGLWSATAHASTVFSAAAGQLGAAYDNTNPIPIGVPAVTVTNATTATTGYFNTPNSNYAYTFDTTNPLSGFNPDFHWLASGTVTQTTAPTWTFSSLAKDYYLYPATDHTPLPDEALESTLWGSSNNGSTWSQGTLVEVYELGWDLPGIADDGASRWSFSAPVDMIAALVGLTQGTYSYSGGSAPLEDYEIDAVMQQVPEPGSAALFLVGTALMLVGRKRRR